MSSNLSDRVYNENVYVPPSDDEELSESDNSFHVLQPVPPDIFSNSNGSDEYHSIPNQNQTQSLRLGNTSSGIDPPDENSEIMIPPRSLFEIYDTDNESGDNESDNGHDSDNSIQTQFSNHDNENVHKLMENYTGDTDNLDDFANGWEWLLTDSIGPSYGPFTADSGLKIHPDGSTPYDYLKMYFPDSMFHHITMQTNLFANEKKQGK